MPIIPVGRLEVATPETMAASVRAATVARDAVDERVRDITPGIIASDPTVAAAAAEGVATALEDASIVTGSTYNERAASMEWGVQDVVAWNLARDTVPASQTVSVQRSLPILTNGKLDPAVLPSVEDGGDISTELALVAERGRPSYAPMGGTFDATRSLFNFHPGQLMSFIVAREKARRGIGHCVILSLGTSISRVIRDPAAGETYAADAWPGQMLTALGLPIAGTGIRHLSTDIPLTSHVGGFAEPTITVANPATATNKVELLALGFAQSSFATITDSGTKTAYVEFNTAAGSYTELWLYGAVIAGTSVVTIDGVDRTWAGSTTVTGADIPALAGYAAGQRISKVTVPAGTHTVRVHGTAAGVPFSGFEGRNATGVILHRGAIAGRSQYAYFLTSGNTDGMAWAIDPWGAHLLVEELHINDWQNHYNVTEFKAQKIELWSRARSKGAAVLAVIAPTPDLTMYPPAGGNNPPVEEYIKAIYEAALASDVPVLDLAHRWVDYPTARAMYAATLDHIHPLAIGASDMGRAAATTLLS